MFILFNTLCGFARTKAELTAFRFIAGFGGSPMIGVRDCCLLAEQRPTSSDGWCCDFGLLESRGAGSRHEYLSARSGPRPRNWPNRLAS